MQFSSSDDEDEYMVLYTRSPPRGASAPTTTGDDLESIIGSLMRNINALPEDKRKEVLFRLKKEFISRAQVQPPPETVYCISSSDSDAVEDTGGVLGDDDDDDDDIDVTMMSKKPTWSPSESGSSSEEPYEYNEHYSSSSGRSVSCSSSSSSDSSPARRRSARNKISVDDDDILPLKRGRSCSHSPTTKRRRVTTEEEEVLLEASEPEPEPEPEAPLVPTNKNTVELLAELRPQQVEGVAYILAAELAFLEVFQRNKKLLGKATSAGGQVALEQRARGVVLADDMGKGKTIQLLEVIRRTLWCSYEEYGDVAAAKSTKTRRTLLIVPKSAVQVWVDQAKEHFRGFRVIAFDTKKTTRRDIQAAHVVVINYDKLTVQKKAQETSLIYTKKWWRVVLDESHYIRNEGTKKLAAVNALRSLSVMRHTCSGTPEQNKPLDLYTTFAFIDAPDVGKHEQWLHGTHAWCYSQCIKLLERHMIRRDDVDDLPPLSIYRKTVRMSKKESELYASVYSSLEDKVRGYEYVEGSTELRKARGQILIVIANLRSICSYPALYDPDLVGEEWASTGCAKFREVAAQWDRIVADDPTAGLLVFSQFSTALTALMPWFQREKKVKSFLFTGKTSQKNRTEIEHQFQTQCADQPVALFISTGSGGTGLTFTRATHVIFIDWDYNPKNTDQALKRAHRIGQTKPVRVTFLEAVAVDHTGKVSGDNKVLETIECGIRLRCNYKRHVFDCLMKKVSESDREAQASLSGLDRSVFQNTMPEFSDYTDEGFTMRGGEWKATAPTYNGGRGAYGSTAPPSSSSSGAEKGLGTIDGVRGMVDQGRHTIREIDEEEQERERKEELASYRQYVQDLRDLFIDSDSEDSDDDGGSRAPLVHSGVTLPMGKVMAVKLLVRDTMLYTMVVERHEKLLSTATYYVNFTQLYAQATTTSQRLERQALGTLRRSYLYPRVAMIYKNWSDKEERVRDFEKCTVSVTAFRVTGGDIDLSLLSKTNVSGAADMLETPQPRVALVEPGTTTYYLLDDKTSSYVEPCGQFELSMAELARTVPSSYTLPGTQHEDSMAYTQNAIQRNVPWLTSSSAAADPTTTIEATTARFAGMCCLRSNSLSTAKWESIAKEWASLSHKCFIPPGRDDCIMKLKLSLHDDDDDDCTVVPPDPTTGYHIYRPTTMPTTAMFIGFIAADITSCPNNTSPTSSIEVHLFSINSFYGHSRELAKFITLWVGIAYAKGSVRIASSPPTYNRKQNIKFSIENASKESDTGDARGRSLLKAIGIAKRAWKSTSLIKVHVEVAPWQDKIKTIEFV